MKEYSYTKRALLRALSENSRATITELATAAKCSRNTVLSNMNALSQEFDIRYTIDFNKEELGLFQKHIIRVNFGKKPSIEALKEIFKDDTIAQLVLVTEGDFDLVIYANAKTGSEYMKWETGLAMKLIPYKPVLRPSQLVVANIGFIPISSVTLEKIDFTNFGMDQLDKDMLLMLNENTRLGYRALSKKLNVNEDMIRYRFRKICKKNFINKFSLVIKKPPTTYNLAFFVNYHFAEKHERRAAHAREFYTSVDGSMPLINKVQFLAPTSGSYRFFAILCFDDQKDAQRNGIAKHRELFREDTPNVYTGKIVAEIRGSMPARNIDVKKDYNLVKWE